MGAVDVHAFCEGQWAWWCMLNGQGDFLARCNRTFTDIWPWRDKKRAKTSSQRTAEIKNVWSVVRCAAQGNGKFSNVKSNTGSSSARSIWPHLQELHELCVACNQVDAL